MERMTLCSRNAHKARELELLLPGWQIDPLDADDYPDETGTTYYENAVAKARFGHGRVGGWTIGEDSGIEVVALGGRPGINSARYAPEGAPAIAKLLGEHGETKTVAELGDAWKAEHSHRARSARALREALEHRLGAA
jgi:XTP/dITP diphosphohydrolase